MRIFPIDSLFSILFLSSFCSVVVVVVDSQGTDLGGGVVTRTDVEYLADVALDVRDIEQSISGGNNKAALKIYLGGKNSGKDAGSLFALTDLSTELATQPVADITPVFLFQLYGLGGRSANLNELSANAAYADGYVRSAIQNGRSTASRAALILNVWMYAADILYKGVSVCQKKTEADNPSQFDIGGGGLDEFIALWIGSGQTHGSSEGYSLYALAEEADRLFLAENDDTSGSHATHIEKALAESRVNSQLKLLYQEGVSLLSMPDVCTKNNPDTAKRLWSVVTRMNTAMYIPLMQMLITAVLEQDSVATDLYASAIIPQTAQCRPSVYDRLKEELLEGEPNFQRTEFILADLQEIYSCFGISCGDIGIVAKEYGGGFGVPKCLAARDDAPMALYKPTTDVHPISRIDLDVLQIRILTSLGSFNYAKFWYLYGRNSPRQRDSDNDPYDFYSLSGFALSTSRQNAEPYYSAFISYHNNPNYADLLIQNTIKGIGKWDSSKSVAQRSAVITESCSFLVVYLHLVAQINDAVNHCENKDQDGEYDLTHPWDEVAALMVGSLEGMEEGGSSNVEDGQLVWGLGTRRAYQFQTLNRRGYAKVNANLEDLLFAGRGEIDGLECDILRTSAEGIKTMTMIPLLQSVLKYAILNEILPADSDSANLALGEVFALAIIPIVKLYDLSSALILEENMLVHQGVKPVRGGVQQVANAIGAAANAMGINPRALGTTPEADPGMLYAHSSAFALRPCLLQSAITTIAIGMIVFLF
mmetsp:Transcript_21965/g.46333  ORF Transcript_21965/g.46333 Transcript_21965/m.46333 type:complete len:762 (+) Transcript_21965:97-2382(+)|eukprot:CAMPEP_0201123986 /NCGR_PEP_ID=MMETSP0850-20130426/9768_1 /ASSEMBLY_ACC=CAM_ASM_000622 /TAXON_ID=183588 /ORGANISM="Pseudo-nitzschia fraudulenta, Strain WWA7" /LENGTH=761 /DNA_ID=CAMNT_0047391129 /DNA_START=84 /DNA_END=2369 /DNA_ORIENTATION=+